jgi:hypothetical protein
MRMQAKGRDASVLLIFVVALLILFVSQAFAQPQGPSSVARGPSERAPQDAATQVQAEAGNVTSLQIVATKITSRWQGFYGNITGNISLGDSSSNTMYNWMETAPRGEIYASNGSTTPVWSEVFCFNFSNNLGPGQPIVQRFNGTGLENTLGLGPLDADGVDETFNRTFTGSFQVAGNTIDSTDSCRTVALNVNGGYQEQRFEEVLLTDNHSIIYTSIIENSQTGFQGAPVDFQLIVGENGDTPEPTNYYLYVELT